MLYKWTVEFFSALPIKNVQEFCTPFVTRIYQNDRQAVFRNETFLRFFLASKIYEITLSYIHKVVHKV